MAGELQFYLGGVDSAALAASRGSDLIAVATKAGLAADVRRMTRNLRLYEQRRACREPWAADDSINAPGPPIDLSLRPLLQ